MGKRRTEKSRNNIVGEENKTTVICEYEFLTENPKKIGYSLLEVDVYGRLPEGFESKTEPNHRLSIRKNLATGRFEAYRHYWGTWGIIRQVVQEDVWYSGTLEKVVEFVNHTYKRIWGEQSTFFQVCRHTEEPVEQGCPYAFDNRKKQWAIELRESIEAEKKEAPEAQEKIGVDVALAKIDELINYIDIGHLTTFTEIRRRLWEEIRPIVARLGDERSHTHKPRF